MLLYSIERGTKIQIYLGLAVAVLLWPDTATKQSFPSSIGARRPLILVGMHHKSGTYLHSAIWSTIAKFSNLSFDHQVGHCHVCVQHNVHLSLLQQAKPNVFLHAVRDPLEMIVSAYQYHLRGAEPWRRAFIPNSFPAQWPEQMELWPAQHVQGLPSTVPLHEHLNTLSLQDGVQQIGYAMISGPLLLMGDIARYLSKHNVHHLIVRLEDFAINFRQVILDSLHFVHLHSELEIRQLLLSLVAFDASTHPNTSSATNRDGISHISSNAKKQSIRSIIQSTYPLCELVRQSQIIHGYRSLECSQPIRTDEQL